MYLCMGGLRWGFRVEKIHSADAVAQNFDEGRGNICVSAKLGGLSFQGNSTEARRLEKFCGRRESNV